MTEPATRIVPLSKSAHAQLRWTPFTDWRFAAGEFMVTLAGMELPRAAGSFPIAFARAGERTETVALLGLEPGRNLFVGPNGEWGGEYVPAMLRARPFALGLSADGQSMLCIDEASPLIVRGEGDGESVFTEGAALSPAAQKTAEFLRGFHGSLAGTWRACDALWRHKCLQPFQFPGNLATSLKQMRGLYQVDESALKALPAEALAELMPLGAVGIAYAQLISLFKLPSLGRLAEVRARENAAAAPDLSVLERDGTIVLAPLG